MVTRSTKPQLSERDRVAMMRSIAVMQADAFWRDSINKRLRTEPFEETGCFAASYCQDKALMLRPWQVAPVSITSLEACLAMPRDHHRGERNAADLLVKMFVGNFSRFIPDPEREIRQSPSRVNEHVVDIYCIANELPFCECTDPELITTREPCQHCERWNYHERQLRAALGYGIERMPCITRRHSQAAGSYVEPNDYQYAVMWALDNEARRRYGMPLK